MVLGSDAQVRVIMFTFLVVYCAIFISDLMLLFFIANRLEEKQGSRR